MDDGLDEELLEAIQDEHYDKAVEIIETYDEEHDSNIAKRIGELCNRLEDCDCETETELEAEAKRITDYSENELQIEENGITDYSDSD